MCGSSSTSKGKGATSSFGGYNFGHGAGSIADQRRAENKAALGRGTNVSNSPGFKGASQSLGGPKAGEAAVAPVDKPVDKPGVLMQRVPVAHVTGFQEMQSALDEDKSTVVNAATYSKLGTMAMKQAQGLENIRDGIETKNKYGPGSWVSDTGNPFGMMNQSFQPNRGIGGSMLDAITGKSRSLSMERAMMDTKNGIAADRAASLASGNTEVDEMGRPVRDNLGNALDVMDLASSVLTRSPVGMLKSGYDLVTNQLRDERLYGSKTAKNTRSVLTPKGQQVAGLGGGTGKGGLVAKDENDEKATTQVAAKKKARRGKNVLNKTGVAGLDDRAPVLMQRLWG